MIVLNIFISLLIPVFLTFSDRVKQRDLNDHYQNYSQKDLITVGMLDMTLFFFILIELLAAFMVFASLGQKFSVKFDVK